MAAPHCVVFIGPPGSGKSTQAALLGNARNVCVLATANMLRNAVRSETQVGKIAKKFMDAGQIIPNDVMVDLIKETLASCPAQNGLILDGFPRTVEQAKLMDGMLAKHGITVDRVFELRVSNHDDLVRRLTGRRVHGGSGRVYHVEFAPPKVADKDDVTGQPLFVRTDDADLTAVKKRIKLYEEQSPPLVEFYTKRGILTVLPADWSVPEVYSRIHDVQFPSISASGGRTWLYAAAAAVCAFVVVAYWSSKKGLQS